VRTRSYVGRVGVRVCFVASSPEVALRIERDSMWPSSNIHLQGSRTIFLKKMRGRTRTPLVPLKCNYKV
jgi:hypothetical protein